MTELNNWPTRAEDIARWAQGDWNRKPDREQTQWMAQRLARLEEALDIYGGHRSCVLQNPRSIHDPVLTDGDCTCGFRAALTDKEGGRG